MRPDPDCRLCPLCEGRTRIVMPHGSASSGVVLVGEAPGESEDLEGMPFVGRSGKILDAMLAEVGLDRSQLLITNTVKCRPPGNRDPTPEEMGVCRRFLESELEGARIVVGLGKSACRDLMGFEGRMSEIVNIPTMIEVRGKAVPFIPTYHPAATIYNKNSRTELMETMRTLAEDYLGRRFSGFMIDMDGTIYKGGDLIPGAVGFVEALRSHGIPFVFLTNNSSRPREAYLEKLRGMGFDVGIPNILTSAVAASRFVASERPGRKVYPVASPEVTEEFRQAGLDIVDDDPDIVLLTFDRTITYEKINKAYRFIRDGAELIATHPDDLCPTEDSYDIDIGPFIRMFEQMCQTEAVVVGKPNGLMLRMAAWEMGVDPESTVMVGDRLYTDMEMASRAGTKSILVLTGETTREMLDASGLHPTYVLDSVADIPALLRGQLPRADISFK